MGAMKTRLLQFEGTKAHAQVFADLWRTLDEADKYIQGASRQRAFLAAKDAIEAEAIVTRNDDGSIATLAMPVAGADVEVQDDQFAIVKECVIMVCDQGINRETASTKHTGRIFDTRRSLAVIDLVEAVETRKPATPVKEA